MKEIRFGETTDVHRLGRIACINCAAIVRISTVDVAGLILAFDRRFCSHAESFPASIARSAHPSVEFIFIRYREHMVVAALCEIFPVGHEKALGCRHILSTRSRVIARHMMICYMATSCIQQTMIHVRSVPTLMTCREEWNV